MVFVTEGELLTECNGHIDTHFKWTVNYVFVVRNNQLSVTILGTE